MIGNPHAALGDSPRSIEAKSKFEQYPRPSRMLSRRDPSELGSLEQIPLAGATPRATLGWKQGLVERDVGRKESTRFVTPSVERRTRRFLVVEDDPLTRSLIRMILEKCGHQVVSVRDGAEALEILETFLPDAIISDVSMPNIDGFTMVEHIRDDARLAHIPVAFLTGNTASVSRLRGLQMGAEGYLSKPVDEEELTECVARLLRSIPRARSGNSRIRPELRPSALSGTGIVGCHSEKNSGDR